jgi:hypothetical protein
MLSNSSLYIAKDNTLFQSEDVHAIMNNKIALRYAGPEIDAMKAVASAHQNRSLLEFEQAMNKYKEGKDHSCIFAKSTLIHRQTRTKKRSYCQ